MIISSLDQSLSPRLEGWCFQGPDLVVGDDGRRLYEEKTGRRLGGGLDGCYVLVEWKSSHWEVSTDSKGLGRIFVYEDGSRWAVSDSLYELASFARRMKWTLSPRWSQIIPHSVRGAFTNQMTSSSSIFEQITLVPTRTQLSISPNRKIRIQDEYIPKRLDYVDALGEYLATWTSRLLTIAGNESIEIGTDLSGGLDSRTVLGFFLFIQKQFPDIFDSVPVASSTSRTEDFHVASVLAEQFGFSLNSASPKANTPRSANYALQSWQEHSLGVYLAVYFRYHSLDPHVVRGHGAGGGFYRPFYSGNDVRTKLGSFKNKLPSDIYEAWCEDVLKCLEGSKSRHKGVNEIITYWREFRNRFHFGHRPHSSVMFMPLNTRVLDRSESDSRLGQNQVYFDIMENLSPGLSTYSFDKSSKNPSSEHIRSLTKVNFMNRVEPGDLYSGHRNTFLQFSRSSGNAVSEWAEWGEAALRRAEVREVLGSDISSRCEAEIASIRAAGAISGSHSKATVDLSYAQLVDFALG